MKSQLHIGIPAFDELSWLPDTLTDLAGQTDLGFEVWVCINQPRDMIRKSMGAEIALQNQATHAVLRRLRRELPFRLHLLDATGPKAAPPREIAGVGWARRQLFDAIFKTAGDEAVGISLDADTRVTSDYVASLRQAFAQYPNAVACALPYYHRLPEDRARALQMLRYEIYLRYFHLNLWRIGSPYAATALGSALAFRGKAYRIAGGFSTRQAGEDFYLLQKLRKLGPVLPWVPQPVYPAARLSLRVPFGTGVLLAEDAMPVIETRFPFYEMADFDRIGQTYAQWPRWFLDPQPLPIQAFLDEKMGGEGPWLRMRQNAASATAFVRACHTRLDGLKLLQCLRYYRVPELDKNNSETQVSRLLAALGEDGTTVPFLHSEIAKLNEIRDRLWRLEGTFQREYLRNWSTSAAW